MISSDAMKVSALGRRKPSTAGFVPSMPTRVGTSAGRLVVSKKASWLFPVSATARTPPAMATPWAVLSPSESEKRRFGILSYPRSYGDTTSYLEQDIGV